MGESVGIAALTAGEVQIPVRSLGRVSNADAAREFSAARYFLIDTPGPFLGKSTVFANGIAFGSIPLSARRVRSEWRDAPAFIIDEFVLESKLTEDRLRPCSESWAAYYRTYRSWDVHMQIISRVLAKIPMIEGSAGARLPRGPQ